MSVTHVLPTHEAIQDVYRTIEGVLDLVREGVPGPLDFTPDWYVAVQVHWMLPEDLEGSRAVMNAYPGTWKQSVGSSAREPIWEFEEELIKITLWAHPDAIQMSVQIP